MKKVLVAAALAAGISGSAFGADVDRPLITKAPAIQSPAWNWTGIYVGVNGGYGWGNSNRQVLFADAISLFFPSLDGSANMRGGVFGGHVGFNWQFSQNWLVGIEGMFEQASLKGTSVSPITPLSYIDTNMRWLASVTPRFGYVNADWLLFAKGGYAAASIDTTSVLPVLSQVALSSTATGWTLGAGVEYALMRNWIVGIEYDYYRLHAGNLTGSYPPAFGALAQNIDPRFSTVTARLSYKFGVP